MTRSDAKDNLEGAEAPSSAAALAELRHDLRTPLNHIIGYCEILIEDASEGREELVSDLEKILVAGKQLLEIVNDQLHPSQFRDNKELPAAAFSKNLRHELRTPLNHIIGYCEMLIEDAADTDDREFVEDLGKILDAGRRLLVLTESLVGAATKLSDRAAVDLDSEDAGVDPSASAQIRAVFETIKPTLDERPSATGRLLVVDDDQGNRELLARRLQRLGHDVATASDGRQALRRVHEEPFDLVLLDIMMPVMNGIEALLEMKDDDHLRHIPVIMISALDELDSIVRCVEMGAEDYLPKPFDPVILEARISASLDKKRLRDREEVHLAQIEAEKERSDELLHMILPHEIVAELMTTGEVAPRRHEGVAVLFSDIVGFTPYCDSREPEEIVAGLQQLVARCEDAAVRHGLEKIKTIGDAFMAACGLLKPAHNPVLSCVQCALEMMDAAGSVNDVWQLRIGIHIGPVVAGVLGRRKHQYDLWGDTVNTAARMESHGVPGGITLSEQAWLQIAHLVEAESLGSTRVKGKGEMKMFRFERFKS